MSTIEVLLLVFLLEAVSAHNRSDLDASRNGGWVLSFDLVMRATAHTFSILGGIKVLHIFFEYAGGFLDILMAIGHSLFHRLFDTAIYLL